MNKERYGIDSQTRNTVATLMEQVLQIFFALVTDAVGKKLEQICWVYLKVQIHGLDI
jgi:hypothetical protein